MGVVHDTRKYSFNMNLKIVNNLNLDQKLIFKSNQDLSKNLDSQQKINSLQR